MNEECVIDGFGPLPAVCPSSIAELGELIRQAAASGTALYPFGGQTRLSLGTPPSKPGHGVDLRKLAQIIDYPARDMTVTVQPGICMRALHDRLRIENLRLPIDVAAADRATLGGVLAINASGPRRYGYGTLRDYVIGISALNDEGNEFKSGGRVVKNVAGYDICKLLVGSLGTLGIITQVTLKLRPLAEEQALIRIACNAAELEPVLQVLHNSRTRPVSLDLLNRVAAQSVYPHAGLAVPESPWLLLIGYEGNADAVSWQVHQLVKEIGAHDQLDARVGFTAQPLWDAVVEWPAFAEYPTLFKANLVPSAVAAFCQHVDRDPDRPALCVHAGSGIVYGSWTAGLSQEQAGTALHAWRDAARKGQGNVIVMRCPSEWKATLSVWGPPPNDIWLMREIKTKFDPRGIFNPGRFLDGI